MPVFDMLEAFLVKKLHFTPSFFLRLVTQSRYVGNIYNGNGYMCSFLWLLAWMIDPVNLVYRSKSSIKSKGTKGKGA
ncbi:hypothetical protein Pint_16780 [Pistacia integerrima]|uniref:Uncharacterized protein n=1 Tax=Pistacia integerrima TaxID=434235 RepID=A0ACC0ZCJ2_9ROSI|nr:hypothetical protein Pint_16780 [Pistacia integerrima]